MASNLCTYLLPESFSRKKKFKDSMIYEICIILTSLESRDRIVTFIKK